MWIKNRLIIAGGYHQAGACYFECEYKWCCVHRRNLRFCFADNSIYVYPRYLYEQRIAWELVIIEEDFCIKTENHILYYITHILLPIWLTPGMIYFSSLPPCLSGEAIWVVRFSVEYQIYSRWRAHCELHTFSIRRKCNIPIMFR